MTADGRRFAITLVAIAAVVGCGAPPSQTPTSVASGAITLPPGQSPFAPPSDAESPSATGCPSEPEVSGPWPFDRLVGVTFAETDHGSDIVTFAFGPTAAKAADAMVRPAMPPFFQGGSGERVEVDGGRFMDLVLDGMTVATEAGEPVLQGPTDLTADLTQVREVAQLEAFEGRVEWIVGYVGPSCVTLATDPVGGRISLEFSHAVP
jgi:hypothetical protein